MQFDQLLRLMNERNATDLFLVAGNTPQVKAGGKMSVLSPTVLSEAFLEKLAETLLDTPERKNKFEQQRNLNFPIVLPDKARFRVNLYRQRNGLGMVIRAISTNIPSLEQLHLPASLRDFSTLPRGLVLCVGSTGSGKTTTLASMVDHRNRTCEGHILTLEDPVEFLHSPHKSLISQREIGEDTHSFADGLQNALRESPDMVLIGEVRDGSTMEAALSLSETGHLCLTTLHAHNTYQAIERVLNFFPRETHENVLTTVALNLQAIIAQRLVPGIDGRRLPITEVLINTPFIAETIRRGALHDLPEAMKKSLDKRIHTFDENLLEYVKQRKISRETALAYADQPDALSVEFRFGNDLADD